MYFFFIFKREKVHFEALWPSAVSDGLRPFQVSGLASLTLLWLTSSTLLHFGKTSKLAFLSAFATPGIVNKFPLLSLCATFRFQEFPILNSQFSILYWGLAVDDFAGGCSRGGGDLEEEDAGIGEIEKD